MILIVVSYSELFDRIKEIDMPKTFPCADTSCRGQTLVNGTPCPKCQERIDRENRALFVDKDTNRLSWELPAKKPHEKKGRA